MTAHRLPLVCLIMVTSLREPSKIPSLGMLPCQESMSRDVQVGIVTDSQWNMRSTRS